MDICVRAEYRQDWGHRLGIGANGEPDTKKGLEGRQA